MFLLQAMRQYILPPQSTPSDKISQVVVVVEKLRKMSPNNVERVAVAVWK